MATDYLSQQRYSAVAIWLHWTIALLLVANLALGLYHDDFDRAVTAWMMFFHKAIGMTVLLLTLVRIAWRFVRRPPPFDPALKAWEAALARTIHAGFYVLLIAIPLSGWMLSSSSGRATDFFGLFEIAPLPVPRGDDAHDLFEDAHELLGKAMMVLIALHVAGALKHHFQGHRHIIGRMAPRFGRSR